MGHWIGPSLFLIETVLLWLIAYIFARTPDGRSRTALVTVFVLWAFTSMGSFIHAVVRIVDPAALDTWRQILTYPHYAVVAALLWLTRRLIVPRRDGDHD